MLFYSINVKGNEYKLALPMRNLISLEDRLGESPLDAVLKFAENKKFKPISIIFHECLQKYHHGIDYEKACDILGDYMEENGIEGVAELIPNIFVTSGLLKEDDLKELEEQEEEPKKKTRSSKSKN